MSDVRRNPGSLVTAKAVHVTAPAECSRLFGALAKTKMVIGKVVAVCTDISKQRARTLIEADWYVADRVIRKKLNLRSVKTYSDSEESDTYSPQFEGESEEIEGTQQHVRRLANQESWDQDSDITAGIERFLGSDTPPPLDFVCHKPLPKASLCMGLLGLTKTLLSLLGEGFHAVAGKFYPQRVKKYLRKEERRKDVYLSTFTQCFPWSTYPLR